MNLLHPKEGGAYVDGALAVAVEHGAGAGGLPQDLRSVCACTNRQPDVVLVSCLYPLLRKQETAFQRQCSHV